MGIDVKYAAERIEYMLEDSEGSVVIRKVEVEKEVRHYEREMMMMEDVLRCGCVEDIGNEKSVEDGGYMIYRCGCSGKGKGR
ncbi:hypothetical protein, partial [Bacillus thuringiensis]|uniref:hypothetical protein n=1 Tax=Bacillus thuringiensis TaxID=1428 RepID=UPI003D6CB121